MGGWEARPRSQGFVDSVVNKKADTARIRTTFATIPDTPVTSFQIRLKGGKEGVIINSANLCAKPRRLDIRLTGQNGRHYNTTPVMGTSCKGKKAAKGSKR